jgi:hypothetical protein
VKVAASRLTALLTEKSCTTRRRGREVRLCMRGVYLGALCCQVKKPLYQYCCSDYFELYATPYGTGRFFHSVGRHEQSIAGFGRKCRQRRRITPTKTLD